MKFVLASGMDSHFFLNIKFVLARLIDNHSLEYEICTGWLNGQSFFRILNLYWLVQWTLIPWNIKFILAR